MIRKTLLLVMLALFAAVATTAWSQNPAGPVLGQPGAGKTPPLPEKTLPAVEKSASPATAAKLPPVSPKATSSATKEGSSSKTFPTSSAFSSASPSSSASRRELVVEQCLVSLINDNKVPASEPGMLIELNVEEGHSIDKDTIVAKIDTRSTLAKQKVAQGEMMAARAQAENNAEIEVAEKAVEVAKAELDDTKEIRRKNPGAVSETQLRKDQFNYEKSLAQVKQATNEKKIAGLTAEAKQAQYEAASIELDLREVRVPFNGQVVEISKRVGDWVTPGETIMHIVGLDRVRVRGFVAITGASGASQEDVDGQPVTITVESVGGKKHTVKGTIGFASPVISGVGTSREFKIWADVDNEKVTDPATGRQTWKIQPGSVATMHIDMTKQPARPLATGKADPSKAGKTSTTGADSKGGKSDGKVQSFKPVTSRER